MTIKPGQKFRGDRGTREITVKSFDKHNEQVIFRRSGYAQTACYQSASLSLNSLSALIDGW